MNSTSCSDARQLPSHERCLINRLTLGFKMRKTVLGVVAALVFVASPVRAALVFNFVFTTEQWGALAGGFQVTLPYLPIYNFGLSMAAIDKCTLSIQGYPLTCARIVFYPDTSSLASSGDIYDAFGIFTGGGGSSYFYFPNGTFSSTGVFASVPTGSVDRETLMISGTPDGIQPVPPPIVDPPPASDTPEPQIWSLLIVGFFGIGVLVRRQLRSRRLST